MSNELLGAIKIVEMETLVETDEISGVKEALVIEGDSVLLRQVIITN